MITPIILSGGNGTRLWPLSRKGKPKQFIKLLGDETMFAQTIKRFKDENEFNIPIILGNIAHESFIDEEIKNNNLINSKIILEPKAKNTAPAISAVVEYLMNNNRNDEIIVFIPSDAYINNIDDFQNYLIEGEELAKNSKVVCFGIQPIYPETGYGYIKLGKKIKSDCYFVDKFVEKPDIEKAKSFLKNGKYLWNAGIFMTKVSVLHDLFEKFQNKLLQNIQLTLKNSVISNNKLYLNKENFINSEEISIDYAIIENLDSSNLGVVSMNLIWSDVGSYKSLYDINSEKTSDNNILSGKILLNNTANCFIKSNKKIICCSDVEDLVVVEENDVILIMKKDKSQNIKKLIEKCKEQQLDDIL